MIEGVFGGVVWVMLFVVFCNFLEYMWVKKCVEICVILFKMWKCEFKLSKNFRGS